MTEPELSNIKAAVVTVDSRVVSGTKPPKGAQTAVSILREAGISVVREVVIDDLAAPLRGEFDRALEAGARLIITIGSTGVSARNIVPETTIAVCDVELPGIAEQIRQEGLKNMPLAVLSRAVVGVTSRTSRGAVIANCPSSSGGVKDTLAVLLPLLRYIYEQLNQTEA
ncbi:molybdenum cofactor synthesis domain-containing protein [Propionimicrobium lymphophilum ACS-093-V-SCH5]|uniref:Molybdenum cofactor synthesis domain-containing protein n=1 Tax=Propionimicrobium lymphophilum ACS-093-V-SCH5 TaxID=883161 RepID=S2W5F6_9ACTN|nr:molybdopterin-binding protein [Propionimicrobium lymphophilum]EPD33505.1 molybdenum cofactor synthesis domain-containing protein [Propionimicrobium lymphophilum ACS-093-V-SCH5]